MKYILFLILAVNTVQLTAQTPIPTAHAHNDYLQKNPLKDALANGFMSIEIDLYLKKGKLVVSHYPFFLGWKKTIEELYLKPLKAHIIKNGGRVYPNQKTPLILMLDLKTDGTEMYPYLKKVFEPYQDLIATFPISDTMDFKPIRLLISGNRPIQSVQNNTIQYFQIDGRFDEFSLKASSSLVPRISDKYSKYFKWKGKGTMPETEQLLLEKLLQKAHQHGKKLRFWGMPNHPNVWKTLLDAGVDWMNVDDLEIYRQFWERYQDE